MSTEFNPYEFPPSPRPNVEQRIATEVVHVEEREEEPQEELTEEELAEEEEERQAEERRIARESKPFWQFISGNWLVLEGITGTYRYLLIVAATLFLSVVSIFYSFHLSEKYSLRVNQVQLLRERSLEYQRVRFNNTSHSAIVKELKSRNIPLYDLQESKTIIEK
ncbi:MAG: hypothetical protein SNH94_06385 [Rikenellaceae bacterium]